MAEKTARKQRGRPFPKGKSCNPKARPKGALNQTTRAAQTILDGEGEALTRKAVGLARIWPFRGKQDCLEIDRIADCPLGPVAWQPTIFTPPW